MLIIAIISHYFLIFWLSVLNCTAGQYGGAMPFMSQKNEWALFFFPVLSSLVIYFCLLGNLPLPLFSFPSSKKTATEDLISYLRSLTNQPSLCSILKRLCFHSDGTWLKNKKKQQNLLKITHRRNSGLQNSIMGVIFVMATFLYNLYLFLGAKKKHFILLFQTELDAVNINRAI